MHPCRRAGRFLIFFGRGNCSNPLHWVRKEENDLAIDWYLHDNCLIFISLFVGTQQHSPSNDSMVSSYLPETRICAILSSDSKGKEYPCCSEFRLLCEIAHHGVHHLCNLMEKREKSTRYFGAWISKSISHTWFILTSAFQLNLKATTLGERDRG